MWLRRWCHIVLLCVTVGRSGTTPAPIDSAEDGKYSSISDSKADFEQMSVEAEQVLLELKKELGFHAVTGSPVRIYRKDLSPNYIAYWQVEVDKTDYLIVSAGHETGDMKFIIQGKLPAPSSDLNTTAQDHGCLCFRYYMLSPMGEMMCEDENGLIVATNIHSEVLQEGRSKDANSKTSDQFVKSRLGDIREEWAKHAMEVKNTGEWDDETVITQEALKEEQPDQEALSAMEQNVTLYTVGGTGGATYRELAVSVGEIVQVALGSQSMVRSVHLVYIPSDSPEGNETVDEINGMQKKLCLVIPICSAESANGLVGNHSIKVDTDTGLAFLEFQVQDNAKEIFGTSEVEFAVELHQRDGRVLVRHYVAELLTRKRRSKETASWSGYTEMSIPHEHLFPDYNQHKAGRCYVGCGPVAWAMIFGYYDRRSHNETATYGFGSQGLYRSGWDGTTGSDSEAAPSRSDSRMNKYTEKLNSVLGTWCIFGSGATWMSRMSRAESFFKSRQTSGTPSVVKASSWLSWLGVYFESIAAWTRSRIEEGWPVIVSTKTGWFTGWHYPVATKYRRRSRRYRNCYKILWWRFCGRWKTETHHEMYLHMGWGGSGNGWKDMKSFFSITAKY